MKRSALSITPVLAALVLACGCGSSSSSSATTASSGLSDAAFLSQLSSVNCAAEAQSAQLGRPKSVAEAATYFRHLSAITEAAKAKIAALAAPADKQTAFSELLKVASEELVQVQQIGRAAAQHDTKKMEALSKTDEASGLEERAKALEQQIGLKQCPAPSGG